MFNPTEWIQKIQSVSLTDPIKMDKAAYSLYQEFVHVTFEYGASGDLTELNQIFERLDPSTIHMFYSSGILRATFSMHMHLPAWAAFRDKTVAVFQQRGEDIKILSGLLDTSWYVQDENSKALGRMIGRHPSLNGE